MRTALAIAMLVAAPAAATPLEPLWSVSYAGPCDRVLARDGQLALVHDRDLVPIDAAHGTIGKRIVLRDSVPHDTPWMTRDNAAIVDGVVAYNGGGWIAGNDAHSGAELWWRVPGGGGHPTLHPAGNELVVATASFAHAGQPGIGVELVDPHTGKPRWHTALPAELGQLQVNGVDVDAGHVYITANGSAGGRSVTNIIALDRATGTQRWKLVELPGSTIVPSDVGVVAAIGGELHVLDATTGHELRRIRVPMKSFVVRDHRVFVATDATVEMYDLATARRGWSAAFATTMLEADATATAVLVGDGTALHALDAATGTDVSSWSTAQMELVYVRADATAPMLVLCGNHRLTALDPTAPIVPIEHATITGEVSCPGCTAHTSSPQRVTVAGATVALSHGKFRVEIAARGSIGVYSELPDMKVVTDGIEYGYHPCDVAVELTGKHRYHVTCTMSVHKNAN